jgi:hypothetical protein
LRRELVVVLSEISSDGSTDDAEVVRAEAQEDDETDDSGTEESIAAVAVVEGSATG